MTELKYPIGSQWKTRGGWRAVVVDGDISYFVAWHSEFTKGRCGATHNNDNGKAVFLGDDRSAYDFIGPWTEQAIPKSVDVDCTVYFDKNGKFIGTDLLIIGDEFAAVRIRRTLKEGEGLV